MVAMRINAMESMGLRVWPPKLVISSQSHSDKAVLMDVKPIVATNLLRVDVEHNMIPDLGIILVEEGDRKSFSFFYYTRELVSHFYDESFRCFFANAWNFAKKCEV